MAVRRTSEARVGGRDAVDTSAEKIECVEKGGSFCRDPLTVARCRWVHL